MNYVIKLLDLEGYEDNSPFTLSGGEKKRVALASVLAWDPKYLILDEPTIGQDALQKERLKNFIIQLTTQDRCAVIVTHDVEFVADCREPAVLGHFTERRLCFKERRLRAVLRLPSAEEQTEAFDLMRSQLVD